jgi:hypothetical protein
MKFSSECFSIYQWDQLCWKAVSDISCDFPQSTHGSCFIHCMLVLFIFRILCEKHFSWVYGMQFYFSRVCNYDTWLNILIGKYYLQKLETFNEIILLKRVLVFTVIWNFVHQQTWPDIIYSRKEFFKLCEKLYFNC